MGMLYEVSVVVTAVVGHETVLTVDDVGVVLMLFVG